MFFFFSIFFFFSQQQSNSSIFFLRWCSQGSLICFVCLLFWYSKGQEHIEEKYGFNKVGHDIKVSITTTKCVHF